MPSNPRLTLRQRDKGFFAHYIQEARLKEFMERDPDTLDNEAKQNLRRNAVKLNAMLDERFGGARQAGLMPFVQFLLQRCFLVTVSTPSQQSAFRVFSVFNSRGMDLAPTDIVKADVIGQIAEPQRDTYSARWEDTEADIGREGFNDLFKHLRTIHVKERLRGRLIEDFREHVLCTFDSSESFIDDVLVHHADAFKTIRDASYGQGTEAEDIKDYLRWLNRIVNTDWMPPAIKYMAAHRSDPAAIAWFFRRLERLAGYQQACGKDMNYRTTRFIKLLDALDEPRTDPRNLPEVELTPEEKEELLGALAGDIYDGTARRSKYIVQRLNAFLSDTPPTYPKTMTVEHVLPRNVALGSQWEKEWPEPEVRERWVNKLGNLVLLSRSRNSQASNFDFEEKKDRYFRGTRRVTSYALTPQVLREKVWDVDVVQARQQVMLSVFKERWMLD